MKEETRESIQENERTIGRKRKGKKLKDIKSKEKDSQ